MFASRFRCWFRGWLFGTLFVIFLGRLLDLGVLHLLVHFLGEFFLALLGLGHVHLFDLALRLLRADRLGGHGLLEGQIDFCAFVHQSRQLRFELGRQLESLLVALCFAEELIFLAQATKLQEEHLLRCDRLLILFLRRNVVPNLITSGTFSLGKRENGVSDHVNVLELHGS